jgi:hypothetical protein
MPTQLIDLQGRQTSKLPIGAIRVNYPNLWNNNPLQNFSGGANYAIILLLRLAAVILLSEPRFVVEVKSFTILTLSSLCPGDYAVEQ